MLTEKEAIAHKEAGKFYPGAIFLKDDSSKIRWSLFPRSVIRDVIKILEFGAKKYAPNNWKLGKSEADIARYWDAFDRHRDALQIDGQYYDPETKLPHTSHMLCNLVFIHYLQEEKRNDKTTTCEAGTCN